MSKHQSLLRVALLLSVSFGVWHLASTSWILGKAHAATFLIRDAWQTTLTTAAISKPWAWSDTWPVAEIAIPAVDLIEIVLAGDSGSALAFGPGLSPAGAALNAEGVKLISAHRDTHFKKLQHITVDDAIYVTTVDGIVQYQVKAIKVVDSLRYSIDAVNSDYDLVLATCYPFNSIVAGGSQRFIVQAIEL